MVERYRIFAFTTFYRADSLPGMRPVNPVSDLETRHLHIPRQEARTADDLALAGQYQECRELPSVLEFSAGVGTEPLR